MAFNDGDDELTEDPKGAPEGVRIMGAEPVADPARAVHWADSGPSWSSTDDDAETIVVETADESDEQAELFDDDSGPDTIAMPIVEAEATELPHWSDPPTGAVPAIFDQADASEDDDFSAFASSSPRFRSDGGDFEEAGFAEHLAEVTAAADEAPAGALAEAEDDSDEEFAAAVAQRRSGSREVEAPRRATPPRPANQQVAGTGRPDPFGNSSAGGRNIGVAAITAGFLGLVALLCFLAGEGFVAVLAAVILGAASVELVATLNRKNLRSAHLVVIAGTFAAPIATWSEGVYGFAVVVGLVIVTTMLWFLLEAGPGRPLIGIAVTLFAFGWVGGLGGFAGLLLHQNDGAEWLLAALLPTVGYDVFGLFVGQQFGKSPIAPRISPNKTIEGTSIGILAAVVIGAALIVQLDPFEGHGSWAVLVGQVAGVAALFGDLCESMIKRDLGIKDFSGSLPGHGGVLDRFDGLLFAMPAVFFLMVHFTG